MLISRSNHTRTECVCPTRFGSMMRPDSRRWRETWSRRSRGSASTPNFFATPLSSETLPAPAQRQVWCDTLRVGSLDPLTPVLTSPSARKVIHAARQDLEAVYRHPVFDTEIAAACIGLKPQVGYAELVKTLLDVSIPKGQTRTELVERLGHNWNTRPTMSYISATFQPTCPHASAT